MHYSTNYNMNKPDLTDQYNLSHWNDNTDIIDTELKKREDDDTALKAPAYTVPASDANLVSGESYQTAFGKIAKAISSFITHKATTTSVHGSTSLKEANKIIERDVNSRARIEAGVDIEDITNLMQIQNSALNKKFIGIKTVATSNITLFGEQVIDNLSCVIGDVILVINQTTSTENGLYIVQSGAWTRHPDYNTTDKINNTLICAYFGTNRDRIYKTSVRNYIEGTTVLSFNDSDYYMSEGAKRFWRHKIDASQESKPALGVPTIWFGPKPSWALDFGNGGGKYLWSNYPELDNDQFKDILTTFSNNGHMTAHDTSGFYVPDLRGLVPIAYGTNGIRISETTAGGNVGEYKVSQNKYHNHSWNPTSTTTGGMSANATHKHDIKGKNDYSSATNNTVGMSGLPKEAWYTNTTACQNASVAHTHNITANGSIGYNGTSGGASKPPTVAFMWIVRFE